MFDALNVAYGEEEKRGFLRLTAETLLFTVLAIVFVVLAIAAVVVLPVALGYGGLGGVAEKQHADRSLAVAVRRHPDRPRSSTASDPRDRARWRWVTWGGGIAAVLGIAVSVLFSGYAANMGSNNETYGLLGTVIAFMTWIWPSATVVLVGAEVNAELEHQAARDTTRGPTKPIGRRGARMADHVADRPRGR